MSIEQVSIRDASTGTTADVLVGLGFNCNRLRVMDEGRAIEVLWSAPEFASGRERPSGSGIPILFPFPGRVKGVDLEWDGVRYTLNAGDGRGNAIHGFVHERPWRVVAQTEDRVVGQFQAAVDDPQLRHHWPADFRITATYKVHDKQLTAHYLIENPDQQNLPCGLGIHPYFRVPLGGSSADGCIVKLPVSKRWELDDMIATGVSRPLENADAFATGLRFADMSFDDVFGGLRLVDDVCTTSIYDPDSKHTLVMSFDRTFRQCVVYNPAHREAVCIEPYTCVPDPFRLHKQIVDSGLIVLAPGTSFEATVRIAVG